MDDYFPICSLISGNILDATSWTNCIKKDMFLESEFSGLVWLVPNHLSTVSSLFTTPHPPNLKTTTLHKKNHTRNGGEVKKRVAARRKKMKRSADEHRRRRK